MELSHIINFIYENFSYTRPPTFLIFLESTSTEALEYFRILTNNKSFKNRFIRLVKISETIYITNNVWNDEDMTMYIKGIAGDINCKFVNQYLNFIITSPIGYSFPKK